jgi:MFS family permease
MTQRAKDASRLARVRRVFPGVVLLFVVAHFSHHLVTALPVPLLPFIRNEFSLDYTRAALVVSAFSVPYGISQLPSGWLSDRFGPRRLLLVGISGVALGGLVVGISAHYAVLLAGLALMGVLGGGYHPSAPILISSVVEPSRRGSALGLHMIGGSASYFLAPLVAAGLAASFGWRLPFIALAIPGFLLGLGFYVLLGRHQKAVAAKRSATSAAPPLQVRTTDWVRLISFIALSGCLAAASMAMLAFVPLYLVDAFDYPEARPPWPAAMWPTESATSSWWLYWLCFPALLWPSLAWHPRRPLSWWLYSSLVSRCMRGRLPQSHLSLPRVRL